MAYFPIMEFEWDEAKNDACFAQRGFDFAYVLRAFFDPDRVIRRDSRWDSAKTAIGCWAPSRVGYT